MAMRFFTALILGLTLVPFAAAQTVRFDTNVGNIDLVLNPNGLAELQGHADNLLAYVEDGRYENVILNRAVSGVTGNPEDDFILQFGGFFSASQTLPSSFAGLSPVESFGQIEVDFDGDNQIDFDTRELRNIRGTVSLALSSVQTTGLADDPGTPVVNSGSASFFVNVSDNPELDDEFMRTFTDRNTSQTETVETGGFVPFAEVVDMSTVDYIMRLNQASISGGSAASSDIPVIGADDNLMVFVERAFVLDPNPAAPLAATFSATLPEGPLSSSSPSTGGLQTVGVPEPPAFVLLIGAIMVLAVLKGPRLYS